MIIACLPSDTTYDVQCPVCGRGFLFLTDESDRAELRRCAITALAAQHDRLKGRVDRRRAADRRVGLPDRRAVRLERRRGGTDRRDVDSDRRGGSAEQRSTEQERRSDAPAFRRASGAAHPREIFYLQGWSGPTEGSARDWASAVPLQPGAHC